MTAPSPRLASLRADLLAAPYELCAQKARLTTAHLRRRARTPRLLKPLERAHFQAYRRALAKRARGAAVPVWRARANDLLMAAWLRLDRAPAPPVVLHAEALAHTLDHATLRVYDHELIVGNPSSKRIGAPIHPDYGGLLMLPELAGLGARETNPIQLTATDRAALEEDLLPWWYRRSVLAMTPLYSKNPGLADALTEGRAYILTQIAGISHVTPDYGAVLRLGFRGIEARVRDQLAMIERTGESTGESTGDDRLAFYRATLLALRAATRFGQRWQTHLKHLARHTPAATRASELSDLADVFGRVPEHPAETFHDALQSLFCAHVIVHQESFQHGVSFGRLDQLLQPYYERDLAAGRIDRARAVELVGCFLAKCAELLPLFFDRATEYFSGLSSASGITLGGTRPDGSCAVNDVSFLFLDAYDQLRLRQPNLHVRVHADLDPAFLDRCLELVGAGGGMPAFFNDPPIVAALEGAGVTPADAADYAIVGCAEWGVPGRSFPAAGAAFVNLPDVLLRVLDEAPDGATLDTLVASLRLALRRILREVAEGNDAIETAHARHRPTPLLSALVGGCLESGRDVTAGGARYDSAGIQGVGLADLVDCLAALDEVVLGPDGVGLPALRRALDADLDGPEHESLRARLLHRTSKYGENTGRTDALAARLTRLFVDEVDALPHRRGGRYRAGFWTMTTHQGFGRRTGALPNGRRAGQPFSSGISPRAGCEGRGPTATVTAAAGVTAPPNGAVLNLRLAPNLVTGPQGRGLLAALLQGYFATGGAQVQLNVVDHSVLAAARRDPEAHRDLVVRVSGYSAYFNDLSDEMKDELVARTLHVCCG